jgi:hypothetical protein
MEVNAVEIENEKVEEAAKALSALGASKGGIARAEKLTPERRSEIARFAVETRWQKVGKLTEIPQATHGSPEHPLRIGDVELPCYVLDDGRRVIVQRGMMTALDMSQGTAGRGAGDRLAKFISSKTIRPFISNKLSEMITEPIKFRTPSGSIAYGYEATALADLCDAVLEARKVKKTDKSAYFNYQIDHIADQCEVLVRSFARVGIIALVDEATGYQDVRAKDALAKILEAFITKELRKWVRTFPTDYYKELFRLRGWKFPNLPADQRKRPILVGNLTNNVVYDRLAPGVRQELKRLTPRDDKGRHKHKLFQRLTEDVGHPKLREHLAAVIALMRASTNWDQFISMLDTALPKWADTPLLPFDKQ